MKQMTNDEIKKLQLDMLIDFTDFCDKNNITYFLSSGTLLGAVRHKGFIPWDDDIDVMLPRPDYERALRMYCNDQYFLDSISINKKSICRCARLNCKNTTLITNQKKQYKSHVFIDAFPIDGITSSKLGRTIKLKIIQIMIQCHMATITAYKTSNHYADKNAGFLNYKQHIRTFGKFALISTVGHTSPQFWAKAINRWLKNTNYDSAKFVGFFAGGYYKTREVMDKSVFAEKTKVEFEGHKFWAPSEYDTYLRRLYDNYMNLPPQEKQKSHHCFKAYWNL